MSAAQLLDRLDGVKATGAGRWIAKCPAHEDRSPSLSVRELEDGRVLVNDFGGCDTESVLSALGLTMADLFERPLAHQAQPVRTSVPARDLLELLDHEISVAALILGDVLEAGVASEGQVRRLSECAARVAKARDIASPVKVTARAA